MLPLCPSNVARRCRATQVRGTGARACLSPPSAPLPTTHPTHKPPRRRFRRGLRVGRRSGSPAPRSRPSSAENGPIPGGSRSRDRGASPAISKRKRSSSSLPSSAARARCLKRSTPETLPTPPGGRNRGRRVLFCSLLSPPAPTPRPCGLDPYGLRYADAVADERPKPPRTASVSTPASGPGGAAVALSRPGRARRPRGSRVRRR
jgi:hypothetical protein